MATKAKRPGIVTVIGVLGMISGVVKVVSGASIALASNKDELFVGSGLTNTGIVWVGIVLMLLGAFTLFLANSILSGAKWAQIWYGVVFTINMVVGLVTVFTNTHGSRWTGLASALVAFIVLQLLFSERAQEYFED